MTTTEFGQNVASGASTGASIGSAVGPVGGVVGGLVGTAVSGISSVFDHLSEIKDKKKYNEELAKYAEQYGMDVQELAGMVDQYYKEKGTLLDESSKKEYKQALTATDWEALGAVDFNKDDYDVNDYYDQNRKQIVSAAENDALGAANISGSVLGSGAVGNMLNAAVSTEKDLADKAFDRMYKDRDFDYGLAKDSASQKLEAVKNKISALGTAYAEDDEDAETYLQTMLGLKNSVNQAKMNAYMNMASL